MPRPTQLRAQRTAGGSPDSEGELTDPTVIALIDEAFVEGKLEMALSKAEHLHYGDLETGILVHDDNARIPM